MNDEWMIKGRAFINCNCAFGCPCQFNSKTTYGNCEAIGCYFIDEGNFNETDLSGSRFALALHWPGEVAEGNGEEQLIVDDRVSDEQFEAIRKIAHGESTTPGATHFFIYNSTMSKVHEPLRRPIEGEIDIDARKAHISIEGHADSVGTPLINPFDGSEKRAGIHLPSGFEYTYAEMGVGNSKVTGAIELELKDSYGQFNVVHMNQDGVIR